MVKIWILASRDVRSRSNNIEKSDVIYIHVKEEEDEDILINDVLLRRNSLDFFILSRFSQYSVASLSDPWCWLAHWFLLAVTFGKEEACINHASRELLVYDSGGQTTSAWGWLNTLMPRACRTQRRGINILLPCSTTSRLGRSRKRLLFRLPHKILCGLWYSACLTTTCTCTHAPRSTVTFRLDMQLGIDKQTNRQNSGRHGAILIPRHFRRGKSIRSELIVCQDNTVYATCGWFSL